MQKCYNIKMVKNKLKKILKPIKKTSKKLADDQARGAQINLLEEVFYDIYPNRWEIYKVNFMRGISFGFGSVIGATVLIFGLIWLLSHFVNIPGGIGEFIQKIIDTMSSYKK